MKKLALITTCLGLVAAAGCFSASKLLRKADIPVYDVDTNGVTRYVGKIDGGYSVNSVRFGYQTKIGKVAVSYGSASNRVELVMDDYSADVSSNAVAGTSAALTGTAQVLDKAAELYAAIYTSGASTAAKSVATTALSTAVESVCTNCTPSAAAQ